MPRAHLVHLLALLVLAALFPARALALNETYQGVLKPENRDPPIPIVVELREVGNVLEGTMETSAPYKGRGFIGAGGNVSGQCTATADLSPAVSLRMYGRCDSKSFAGTYSLADRQKRIVTQGTFELTRKAPETEAPEFKRSTNTAAACLKANAQCLNACPRGNENAEFVCSNHCRTKFKSCKAHVKRAPRADAP